MYYKIFVYICCYFLSFFIAHYMFKFMNMSVLLTLMFSYSLCDYTVFVDMLRNPRANALNSALLLVFKRHPQITVIGLCVEIQGWKSWYVMLFVVHQLTNGIDYERGHCLKSSDISNKLTGSRLTSALCKSYYLHDIQVQQRKGFVKAAVFTLSVHLFSLSCCFDICGFPEIFNTF